MIRKPFSLRCIIVHFLQLYRKVVWGVIAFVNEWKMMRLVGQEVCFFLNVSQ